MTDHPDTEARGCDSLPQALGPDGEAEGSARSIPSGEGQIVDPSPICAGSAAAIVAVISCDDGREPEPRSVADDQRIALHESCHAVVGRLLGQPLGGITCDAGNGFSGLTWGPTFQSKFAGGPSAPSLCAQIGPLMPGPGESRAEVADIFLHCHIRVVELCAGTVGESLFLDGPAWDAVDDRAQEQAYAALIASSADSIEAFIGFACTEAAAMLKPMEHVVRALTAELLVRRTMDGPAVDAVIAQAVTAKAVADEQRRRAYWAQTCANGAAFNALPHP